MFFPGKQITGHALDLSLIFFQLCSSASSLSHLTAVFSSFHQIRSPKLSSYIWIMPPLKVWNMRVQDVHAHPSFAGSVPVTLDLRLWRSACSTPPGACSGGAPSTASSCEASLCRKECTRSLYLLIFLLHVSHDKRRDVNQVSKRLDF